jgi:hypothetical protein
VRLACTGLVLGTAESRQEPILFPSGTEGLQTLCWREMDSNHRYRMRNNPFWLPPFGPRNSPSATKTGSFVPGTDGSNPSPSTSESCANLFPDRRRSGPRTPPTEPAVRKAIVEERG